MIAPKWALWMLVLSGPAGVLAANVLWHLIVR